MGKTSPQVSNPQRVPNQPRPPRPCAPGVLQPKTAAPQVRTPPAAPPPYRPQAVPKCLQPKAATPTQGRVPAPPASRPRPTPKVLQRKTHPTQPRPAAAAKSAPAAPPVYGPQPVPRVLQPKVSAPHHPASQTKRAPTAPPAYRPQPAPKVLQAMKAGGAAQQARAGLHPKSARPSHVPARQGERRGVPVNRGGNVVQRLVGDGYWKLYVPPAWLDTAIDEYGGMTVRQVVNDQDNRTFKEELFANIKAAVGDPNFDFTEIAESTDPEEVPGLFMSLAGNSRRQQQQLRTTLQARLREVNAVTYLPLNQQQFKRKLITLPQHLVKSPNDLKDEWDIETVCPLIALYKSDTDNNKLLVKSKLGITKRPGGTNKDQAYYRALHEHYHGKQNIQYTEPSTHPALYSDWGFNMIYSGYHTEWDDLHQKLSKPLTTGKQYIIGLHNHSVNVTMKKDFTPGVGRGEGERYTDYFEFHGELKNFTLGELGQQVDYIYEK